MRPRTRSIRFKLVAFLSVPVITLVGLWVFVATVTGQDALEQRRADLLDDRLGAPSQRLLTELGQERLRSAMFLAEGTAAERDELTAQRARTDAAAAALRVRALASGSRNASPAATRRLADELLRRMDRLPAVRSTIDRRPLDRLTTLADYDAIADAALRFAGRLPARRDISLDHGTRAIVTGQRGLDLLGRESALLAAASETDPLTAAERRTFAAQVATRRFLMDEARAQLTEAGLGDDYGPAFGSPALVTLGSLEDQIVAAPDGAPLPADLTGWQPAAESLGNAFDRAEVEAHGRLAQRSDALGEQRLLRLGLAGGLGLVMVLASILLSIRFGRGLTRELVGLQTAARELAEERLPRLIDTLRQRANQRTGQPTGPEAGTDPETDVSDEDSVLEVGRSTEVAAVAKSFAAMRRTAVEAAMGQAELRTGISQVFVSLARRNQSLLHRQLAMLDTLESRAEPDVLEDLFRLDHLTTRMRRHSESLIILSGASSGRGWREPVGIVDVLRGAVAEVEDYMRVVVLTNARDAVVGSAVADVIHLVAELVENATSFSPPTTEVHLMAEMVANGLAVEIEDRGLGMSPAMLAQMNEQLANPPEFDLADTDQLGLFVVARLAERHDINVSLRRSPYGGTTAIVLLPHGIVVPAAELPVGAAPAPAALMAPAAAPTPRYATRRHDRASASEPAAWPLPAGTTSRPAALDRADPPARTGAPERTDPPEPTGLPKRSGRPRPTGTGTPAPAPWPGSIPVPQTGALDRSSVPERPETPERAGTSEQADTPERTVAPEVGDDAERASPEPVDAETTHAGLPRRVRQQSIAPQLRGERPEPPSDAVPQNSRSPEAAGALIASMQAGWRRGRAEAETTTDAVDGEGAQ